MKDIPSWYYNQSAVIPYRFIESNIEILLITSIHRKRWVIPKGVIDLDLTSAESAAKEAFEEAGVLGDILPRPIGEYTYPKWKGICKVEVFILKVHTILDNWPEKAERERQWLSIAEAAEIVKKPQLRKLIRSVSKQVRGSR